MILSFQVKAREICWRITPLKTRAINGNRSIIKQSEPRNHRLLHTSVIFAYIWSVQNLAASYKLSLVISTIKGTQWTFPLLKGIHTPLPKSWPKAPSNLTTMSYFQ